MPVYYNDGLDDPVQYDRQASFVGGQISNFRENLLNESQAESLKDLDTEKNGILKSRRGFHRFADLLSITSSTNIQALAYFDTDTKESLLAFVNGNIYGVDSSATVTTVASASSYAPENQMYSCQVADKLFYSNYISSNRIGQLRWTGAAWEARGLSD
ncbi:uncharacterized protein METZ01_LOCUS360820, partial [marine metagenome]